MLAASDALLKSTTAANLMLVGAAIQCGALKLPPSAVEEALEINGVAVAANKAALAWGRLSVADPAAFAAAVAAATPAPAPVVDVDPTTVVEALAGASFGGETRRLAELRAVELVGFADLRCAEDYVAIVDAVWQAERRVTDRTELSEAVARHLYKLTAYKDEYEVARLLTRPRAAELAQAAVPGGTDLTFKLHPPMLRALGMGKKIGLTGSTQAVLKALVPMKKLRGTALDPFGRAHVRKVERELLRHYRVTLRSLTSSYPRTTSGSAAKAAVRS